MVPDPKLENIWRYPLAPVTTPFDIDFNRNSESVNKHGSVGMGFGATIARNENTPFKLYAIDLTYRETLIHKLNQIANYYKVESPEKDIHDFLQYAENLDLNICTLPEIINNYGNVVFEGAQGVMLDMDFGFFPNVTRSNTTSKNAMKMIRENRLPEPDIYYAMRSYLTRHGNGYMPNECANMCFEDKTNLSHKYQGNFRQGYHSLEMLKYAINCDSTFSGRENKNLTITCVDQTDGLVLLDNKSVSIEQLAEKLQININRIIVNTSPNVETMKPHGNTILKTF